MNKTMNRPPKKGAGAVKTGEGMLPGLVSRLAEAARDSGGDRNREGGLPNRTSPTVELESAVGP